MLFLVDVAALAKPALIAYRTVSVEFAVDLHRLANDGLHLLRVFLSQLVRIAVCRVSVPRSETLEDGLLRDLAALVGFLPELRLRSDSLDACLLYTSRCV